MKIQIPEPCHEDWNKMSPKEKGRFCGSCQKVVVDFSTMTDAEIINYFKEYGSENKCGFFSKTQINRTLQSTEKKTEIPSRKFFFKELVAASVAFSLTSTTAKSQNDTTQVEYHQKIQADSLENIAPSFAINGKVVDGNKALVEAIISIKGTDYKTTSLENGIFSFLISKDTLQNQDSIILVAEYKGFEPKETKVAISSTTNQFVFIDFAEAVDLVLEETEPLMVEKLNIISLEGTIRTLGFVHIQPVEYIAISECFIMGNVTTPPPAYNPEFKLNPIQSKQAYKENIKTQEPNNQSQKRAIFPPLSKWYTRIRLYQNIKDLMKKTFS